MSSIHFKCPWCDYDFSLPEAEVLQKVEQIKNDPKTPSLQEQLLESRMEELKEMIRQIDEKDRYTAEHSERVARSCVIAAAKLRLSPTAVEDLYRAALLHDVGKICIREDLLLKKGLFTPEEKKEMESHARAGYMLLKSFSGEIAYAVLHHHERWDGKGYPDGLEGNQIPVLSRIIAILDTVDAMATNRPYREALNDNEIMMELIGESGKQFDPALVRGILQ